MTTYDLNDLHSGRFTVRPARGPYCPAQVRITVRSSELIFELASDNNWRLCGTEGYAGWSGIVRGILSPDLVDRYDASGAVIHGTLAMDLDEMVEVSC